MSSPKMSASTAIPHAAAAVSSLKGNFATTQKHSAAHGDHDHDHDNDHKHDQDMLNEREHDHKEDHQHEHEQNKMTVQDHAAVAHAAAAEAQQHLEAAKKAFNV